MPETTDFELLQQAMKPLRETVHRLTDLAHLLAKDRPFQDLPSHHSQRRENTLHIIDGLELALLDIEADLWHAMFSGPLTLTPEGLEEYQTCRVCGCTEEDACPVPTNEPGREGCSWAESDLCSVCADLPCSQVETVSRQTRAFTEMMEILLAFRSGEITLDEATCAIGVGDQEMLGGLRDLIQQGKRLAQSEAIRLKEGK